MRAPYRLVLPVLLASLLLWSGLRLSTPRPAAVGKAIPVASSDPAPLSTARRSGLPALSLGLPLPRLPAAAPEADGSAPADLPPALAGRTVAEESELLPSGDRLRVRILEIPGMRHLVRREELLTPGGGAGDRPLARLDTAAGHFLARLPAGLSPAAALARLAPGSAIVAIEPLAPDGAVIVRLAAADPASLPDALRAHGADFLYAEPDAIVSACATPDDPRYASGELWALRNTGQNSGLADADIDADEAWDTLSAAPSVVVAVIDTGLRLTHEDLAANLWTNAGEIPGNSLDDDANGVIDDIHGYHAINGSGLPADDHGHGTHCGGTIAAVGDNHVGIVGVAWHARLMAVKFLGANGSGFLSDAIRAIDYSHRNGARILNNSWGGGAYYQSLADAIGRARDAGAIFVAAAGNNASSNDLVPFYPAGYPHDNLLSVAATTRTDALASFSNHGATTVDIAAPGAAILSCGHAADNAYLSLSGTSMAAPHASGALALLAARFPSEDPAELIDRLLAGADHPATLAGRTRSQGRLNLAASLALATVVRAPAFTASPLDQTVAPGQPAELSVVVSGSGPFTYQWRRNGFAIPGATSATYSIAAAQAPDEGRYSVLVANSTAGSVSAEAWVRVGSAPVVSSGPADQTLPPSAPLVLSVSATGPGVLAYRWTHDGAPIPDAVYPTLDLPAALPGAYRAEVSNAYGLTLSRVATVVLLSPPAITTDPADRSVAAGGFTTFSGAASGSAPLAWQWFKNGLALPGETSANLFLDALSTTDAGSYCLRATNAAGVAWTSGAALRVTTGGDASTQPAVTTSPADADLSPGTSLALAPAYAGNAPLTFAWYKDGVLIPGATSDTLPLGPVAAGDAGTYTLVATNSFGAASSRGVRVVVRAAPDIVTDPASQTARLDERVALEVVATGTAPLSYAWFHEDAPIPGATQARLVLPALQTGQLGRYVVTVTNSLGSATSAAAVIAPPADQPGVARWRQMHPLGPVENLCSLGAHGDMLAVGATGGGLATLSRDGVWHHAETGLSRLHRVHRLLSRNGTLHAFGFHTNTGAPVLLRSTDGRNWSQTTPPQYVSVSGQDEAGFYGFTYGFARSTDGINWTTTSFNSSKEVSALARGPGGFVAVGSAGNILHSPDGLAWTQLPALDAEHLLFVCHGHAGFVAASHSGAFYHSPDGLAWTRVASPTSSRPYKLAYGEGRYVAVGGSILTGVDQPALTLVSTDGVAWRRVPNPGRDVLAEVAHLQGRFYAAGGRGTLLVSEDGETWSDLSPVHRFGLLAVAATPGRQVAVGAGYLVYNSQNGRDWVTERAPRSDYLVSVAHGAGRWLAAANDGNLYTSLTGVADWQPVPLSAGPLISLHWLRERFFATAESGALLSSSDGLGWDLVASTGGAPLRSIAASPDLLVAVGDDSALLVSPDGAAWTPVTLQPLNSLRAVAHGAGRFVALSSAAGSTLVSPDGLSWTPGSTGQTTPLTALAFGAGRFVAVGNSGAVLTSADGETWAPVTPAFTTAYLTQVRFFNGQFLACGGSNSVFRSPDGLAWTAASASILNDIGWSGSSYVGIGFQRLYTSPDAQTWTSRSFTPFRTMQFNDIIHAAGQFVSVGNSGVIETSPDGQSWTPRVSNVPFSLSRIAYGAGRYVAIGSQGWRAHSADGVTWTAQLAGDNPRPSFYALVHDGQRFISGGTGGAIHTSEDGITWTPRVSGITSQIDSLAVGAGRIVALGFNGELLASDDGVTWTGRAVISYTPRRVNFVDGLFLVEDYAGLRTSSPDGLTWSAASAPDAFGHYDVAELQGATLAVQNYSTIRARATPPRFTLQPAGASVRVGGPAFLAAEAVASGPLAYSWFHDDAPALPAGARVEWARFPSSAAGRWRARAEGLGGVAESDSALLSLASHPADAWRVARFGETTFLDSALEASIWGWTADPDGDGMNNLLSYALGDPTPGSPAAGAVETLPDGRLRTVFVRRRDDPALATFAETSANLDVWTSGPGHVEETAVEPLDEATERVTAETSAPAAPARFLRVRVQSAEE